jgi:hypothetical protein
MRAWLVVLVVASTGCDGSDPRRLTKDDVTGIPPGDATGTGLSGYYGTTEARLEGCRCRVGSCSSLVVTPGDLAHAVQTDGVLEMIAEPSGAVAKGGVNADGTFRMGYVREDVGNVQYALMNGRFMVSNGTPVSLQMVQEATGVNGGFDCDIRTSSTALYLGSLAAATEDGLTASNASRIGFGLVEVREAR